MKKIIAIGFAVFNLTLFGQYNITEVEFPLGADRGKETNVDGTMPEDMQKEDLMPHYLMVNNKYLLQVMPDPTGKMRMVDENFQLIWEVDFPESDKLLGKGLRYNCRILNANEDCIFEVDVNASESKWLLKIVNITTHEKIIQAYDMNKYPYFKNSSTCAKGVSKEGLTVVCFNSKTGKYNVILINNSGQLSVAEAPELGKENHNVAEDYRSICSYQLTPEGSLQFCINSINKKQAKAETYVVKPNLSVEKIWEFIPEIGNGPANFKSSAFQQIVLNGNTHSYLAVLYSNTSGPQNKDSYTNNYLYAAHFKNGEYVNGIDGPFGDYNKNDEATTIYSEHPMIGITGFGKGAFIFVFYFNTHSSSFGGGYSVDFQKEYRMRFDENFEITTNESSGKITQGLGTLSDISFLNSFINPELYYPAFDDLKEDEAKKFMSTINKSCLKSSSRLIVGCRLGEKLIIMADRLNEINTKAFIIEKAK